MTTKNRFVTAGVIVATLSVAAVATAHAGKEMEPPVAARHAQMQLIAYNTGILGAMAKGEKPYDAATASAAAGTLAAVAKLDRSLLWVENTEQGETEGSRAKVDIWLDAAGFEEKAKGLEVAADAMVAAAGTDLEGLRGAMAQLGGACKACHETYRGPKNE